VAAAGEQKIVRQRRTNSDTLNWYAPPLRQLFFATNAASAAMFRGTYVLDPRNRTALRDIASTTLAPKRAYSFASLTERLSYDELQDFVFST
jgi:hypothetical protein